MDFRLAVEAPGRLTDSVRLWWEVRGIDCLTVVRLRKVGARAKRGPRGEMCIYSGNESYLL